MHYFRIFWLTLETSLTATVHAGRWPHTFEGWPHVYCIHSWRLPSVGLAGLFSASVPDSQICTLFRALPDTFNSPKRNPSLELTHVPIHVKTTEIIWPGRLSLPSPPLSYFAKCWNMRLQQLVVEEPLQSDCVHWGRVYEARREPGVQELGHPQRRGHPGPLLRWLARGIHIEIDLADGKSCFLTLRCWIGQLCPPSPPSLSSPPSTLHLCRRLSRRCCSRQWKQWSRWFALVEHDCTGKTRQTLDYRK